MESLNDGVPRIYKLCDVESGVGDVERIIRVHSNNVKNVPVGHICLLPSCCIEPSKRRLFRLKSQNEAKINHPQLAESVRSPWYFSLIVFTTFLQWSACLLATTSSQETLSISTCVCSAKCA